MSLWDSLRAPLLSNDAWIEMSQTINMGLARINAANVINAVTASANRLVEGITGTEAFQNALSVSREALGTASTSYMDAGVQEISNVAGDCCRRGEPHYEPGPDNGCGRGNGICGGIRGSRGP